jgi:Mg-chelatase subunit ChlD
MAKKDKSTHVYFILDETGSMGAYKQQTIDGFNEYIQGLQGSGEKFKMSLTLFNSDETELRYDAVEIDKVEMLHGRTYRPESTTPLYDAIGATIKAADAVRKKGDKVLFVIFTDGLENASHEFTRQMIFDMISARRDAGWAFVYLGANQDAWEVGGGMGISMDSTSTFDQSKTKAALRVASRASVAYAANPDDADRLISKDDSWEIQ